MLCSVGFLQYTCTATTILIKNVFQTALKGSVKSVRATGKLWIEVFVNVESLARLLINMHVCFSCIIILYCAFE